MAEIGTCSATELADSSSNEQRRRHELQSLAVVLAVKVVNCWNFCFTSLDGREELVQETVHGSHASHNTCEETCQWQRSYRRYQSWCEAKRLERPSTRGLRPLRTLRIACMMLLKHSLMSKRYVQVFQRHKEGTDQDRSSSGTRNGSPRSCSECSSQQSVRTGVPLS